MNIADIYDSDICNITIGDSRAVLLVDELLFESQKMNGKSDVEAGEALAEIIERLAKPTISLGKSSVVRSARAWHILGAAQDAIVDAVKKKADSNSTLCLPTTTGQPPAPPPSAPSGSA